MSAIQVERVSAPATYPLRQSVLRPHQSLAEMPLPGDDDPSTGHFAAVDESGRVIGVGSVRPDPAPWSTGSDRRPPADVPAGVAGVAGNGIEWRLRGMATADGRRSRGVGAAVLAAVMGYVADSGGRLLWCNARTSAIEFYRRAGLSEWGEPWDEPHIGPHIVMYRTLPA